MPFNLSVLKLPALRRGSTGTVVRAWQTFLRDLDYPIGTPDGQFGPMSEAATRSYQQRNGLPVTGTVETVTYDRALANGFIYRLPNFSANLLLDYIRFGEAESKDLQIALNKWLNPKLTTDGDFGFRSQQGLAEVYRQRPQTFRLDLEAALTEKTKKALGDDLGLSLDFLSTYAKQLRTQLSGAHWYDQFPTSHSIQDLASPFRERVLAFQKAVIDAGAQTIIAATYRPPERAFLMHYSARVSRYDINPRDVPAFPGVDIQWLHYTDAIARQEAAAMVDAYGIGGNPVALRSRHTQRLAIDWNITWENTLQVKDSRGRTIPVGTPQDSSRNTRLFDIGASYGVYKLDRDPPHWSVDGA